MLLVSRYNDKPFHGESGQTRLFAQKKKYVCCVFASPLAMRFT